MIADAWHWSWERHGAAGMWDELVVSAEAEAPYATIDKARLEESDQPGRK